MLDLEKIDAQPRTTKGTVLLTTPEWEAMKSECRRLTKERDEWKAKFIALGQAALLASQ